MKQKSRWDIGGIGVIVVASWLASCGGEDGPPPRTLTTADVTGMPAGDATGTTFSGTYVVMASAFDGCRCRSGSCATFSPVTGGLTTVVQDGGMLTIQGNCFGGVNADGAFWCGGSRAEMGGGLSLAVNEGTFMMTAGKVSGLEVVQELTIVATIDGRPHDCDLRGHATARLAAQ